MNETGYVEPGLVAVTNGRVTGYFDLGSETARLEVRPHSGPPEIADACFERLSADMLSGLGDENFQEVMAAAFSGRPFSAIYKNPRGEFNVRTGVRAPDYDKI
jgi:hypothetical protein